MEKKIIGSSGVKRKSDKKGVRTAIYAIKWFAVPLTIYYLLCNFHMIIIFFSDLFWNFELDTRLEIYLENKYGVHRGIDKYSDIVIYTLRRCLSHKNIIPSLIITALFIPEIVFEIKHHEKHIIKWIIYSVLIAFILVIAFIAPRIYLSWLPDG